MPGLEQRDRALSQGGNSAAQIAFQRAQAEYLRTAAPGVLLADAGDIWLYGPDGTALSDGIAAGENLIGNRASTGMSYSHASINVTATQVFSDDHRGAGIESTDAVIDDSIIGHHRRVDIMRPVSGSFNEQAALRVALHETLQPVNVYGLNGVCSTEVAAAARAGGVQLRTPGLLMTPNSLANQSALRFVGSYDGQRMMSIPAR